MTFCLCGHDAGSHSRLRFNCLATNDQRLRCSCGKFDAVPPASAPAATPEPFVIANAGWPGDLCRACGEPFTAFDRRVSWTVEGWKYPTIGPIHEKCQRYTAAQQDALAKILAAAKGEPRPAAPPEPVRYSTPACPEHGDACIGAECCCADKHPSAVPTGEEAETLRKRFDLILAHITPKISAGDVINLAMCNNEALEALTAQATALAALRARVEELQQQIEGWTKKDQQQEPKPKGESPNA